MKFALLLAMIGLALTTLALLQHRAPNDGLPLVKADYPLCVTIRPGPFPNGRKPSPESDKETIA